MASVSNAASRSPFSDSLREAGITALVSAALLLPIVGFKIVNRGGDQFLDTRWPEMAIAVLLIFLGRLALNAVRDGVFLLPAAGGAIAAAAGWAAPMPTEFLRIITMAGGLTVVARAGYVFYTARGQASGTATSGASFLDTYRQIGRAHV